MKNVLTCLMLVLSVKAHCQNYAEMAKDFQQRFKDDEAMVIQSTASYDFSPGTKAPVKVAVSSKDKLLSLRYNSSIYLMESYDQNSRLEKFFASSNMKQNVTDEQRFCGPFTSEGLFYDDRIICTHRLRLKELGEVWDVTSVKTIDDARYLTAVYFQDRFPLTTRKITFSVPDDIEIELKEFNFEEFTISKSERKENGKTIIEYVAKDLPSRQVENLERGDQYNLPHVLVLVKSVLVAGKKSSVLASPQDLYGWYSNLIRQLNPNPQVFQTTVKNLIQGKNTDEEKIEAIYYWVQDNIRYIAFEDGVAGFKPSEAHEVFEKRYGDCKGMANLTKEMLRAVGYDARLTWIGTRRIMYDHSLPSLAVNNHMICTVLLNGKKYFLDATEKYVPFGVNAIRIQGQPVMIEDGNKFILDKVAIAGQDTDGENRTINASIVGENLEAQLKVDLKGEVKKNFLYSYHFTKTEKREEFVSDFISASNKNIKTSELKLDDLEKRNGPFSLACSMTFLGAVSSFNNEFYVDIDPSKSFKDWEIKDTRQNDIDFGERINNKTAIELAIPEGYRVSHLPQSVEVVDPEFSFVMRFRQVGNKIIYTKEIRIPDGIIRKKSFSRWNDGIKKLNEGYENQIILKK